MLNISLMFQKYFYSFYAQQSIKLLPYFAFRSIKMAKNRVNHINERNNNNNNNNNNISGKRKSLS
jgi:hypothetical protein